MNRFLHPGVLVAVILGLLVFVAVLTSQAYALRIRWQSGELEMKPAVYTAPLVTTTTVKTQ